MQSASNVPASHHPFRRCPNPHSSSRSTQVSGSVVREVVLAAAKLPCPARHPRSPGSIRPPGSSGAPGEHRLLRTALQAVAEKAGSASSIEVPVPAHWDEQMRTAPMGKRRVLERYCAVLEQINALEPRMRQHSDAQLTALTADFKSRLARGASLDDLLPEAFAAIREVARRVLGMRHFDSQMIGGMVLHDGQIAEMATGEGKTLVATLPAYLNALTGSSVHVVTVNEYLAARDAQWMGKVFSFMGLSCAAVSANMTTTQYKAAYACDITYVTGQELGFAYLRDNTARSEFEVMLPARLHYAIVDEADSILIDESRNPMIISLPVAQNAGAVLLVDKVVRPIWTQLDAQSRAISEQERRSLMTLYQGRLDEARLQAVEKRCREVADAYKALVIKVDLKARSITLTPEGAAEVLRGLVEEGVVFRAAQEEGREPSVTDMFEDPGRWGQLALTAFRAYELHTRGKQYIVKDGRVIIVDEHTGRLRDITRWQEGLHQAVEAKEGVSIKEEAQPTATITFQIFFGYYAKLAGMTGTAAPAAAELFELYGLKVVQVPTNRPRQRKDLPCRFYFDPEQKAAALCSIVQRAWATGRPVLIGTTSVQESERVLQQLLQGTTASWSQRHQAAIQVLNATPEKVRQESQIVAQAGLPGSVTIATNMAGRGTDIILGGSPEGLTKMALLRLVYRHMMTDEESELLAPLPAQLQSGPLGAYDCDDLQQALQAVSQGADSGQQGAGLPLPVYTALAAAMLLAHSEADLQRNRGGGSRRRAGRQGPQPISYETAVARAKWCIDQAYGIRREAYERVREAYNGLPQEQLEWSTCIAPLLADVLAEREHLMASAPQGQQFAAKAALFLWAWLDRECARWGAEVRAAGGLLVVGTSVQESRRIELQLRGRAGRQGDPGMTVFLYDISDPYMAIYNVNGIFNMVQQLDQSSGQVGTYVDGALVDTLVAGTQRSLEAAYSNARLEMKRYDQVVEDYRHSVYALRRIILLGSVQQRTQVLYMFIQFWVDELVARLLGSGRTSPDAWLQPSLPLASLPRAVRAAAAAQEVAGALPTQPGVSLSGAGGQDTHHNSDRSSINSNSSGGGRGSNGNGSGGGGQPGGAGGQGSAHPGSVSGLVAGGQGPGVGGGSAGGGGLVSPLEALLRHVEVLVNPSGQTLRPQWQLAEVQGGIRSSEGVRRLLSLAGVLQHAPGGAAGPTGAGANGDGRSSGSPSPSPTLSLPLDNAPLTLLSPEQMAQLAAFLTDTPLPSPGLTSEGQHTGSQSSSNPYPGSSSSSSSSISSSSSSHPSSAALGPPQPSPPPPLAPLLPDPHSSGMPSHSHSRHPSAPPPGPASAPLPPLLPPPPSPLRRLLRALGIVAAPAPPPLPWPQPPGYTPSARQALALITHARLYGFHPPSTPHQATHHLRAEGKQHHAAGAQGGQGGGSSSSSWEGGIEGGGVEGGEGQAGAPWLQALPDEVLLGGSLPSGAALPGLAQRPPLQGPHAAKVAVLRNYLGVLLIQCFERRRLDAQKGLLQRGSALLDIDAQDQVWTYEGDSMLLWLDAFWSVFLEEVEAVKKAVVIKSYGSSNPLDEFRLEANRAFLSMLAAYREAVVGKVLVPEITVSTPLDDLDDLDDLDQVALDFAQWQQPLPDSETADWAYDIDGDGESKEVNRAPEQLSSMTTPAAQR